MKNIIIVRPFFLMLLSVGLWGCNEENHLSDLDTCAQMEKKEFTRLQTKMTDKFLYPSVVFNTENYLMYYASVSGDPRYGWVVINKQTNEIKDTITDDKDYYYFAPHHDKVYLSMNNFKINVFDATDNTIKPLPGKIHSTTKNISGLDVYENHLYILGYSPGAIQIIKYNLQTGNQKIVSTLTHINNKPILQLYNFGFHVYKNDNESTCIFITVKQGIDLILYSFEAETGKQEYFHKIEGNLKSVSFIDQANNFPLIEINKFSTKFIFNYRDNILTEYTQNDILSGKYILSNSGTITDIFTGTVLQTFRPPLDKFFKPLFFDPAINALFCEHEGNFKRLNLTTNCLQGNGLEAVFHTYIDPKRKTTYELYNAGGNKNEISIYSY